MASYFDAQPHSKSAPEREDDPNEAAFGRPSLLGPQVTSILDELEDHSSSSSSEEEDDNREKSKPDTHPVAESDKQNPSNDTAEEEPLHKSGKLPRPKRRPQQPHIARFHSLRSMLFQSNIERNIQSRREQEHQQADPCAKWKDEHDQRRGLNRTKTPEPPLGSQKEGLAHRVGNKLRRLASKDAPTMTEIQEDDRESTASSDGEEVQAHAFEVGKKHDEQQLSDDESIHHSDVEDLVRWVSRKDPPSDGESRKREKTRLKLKDSVVGANDSGHESLGHSDVEDLVHWVGRKTRPEDARFNLPSNYDETSTESDSQNDSRFERERSRSNKYHDEDSDELVRWVSRREGADAGPVKKSTRVPNAHEEPMIDSDHSGLERWVTKEDNTSGESDVDVSALATTGHSGSEQGRVQSKRSLSHKDIDDLVRWVSRTSIDHHPGAGSVDQSSRPTDELLSPTNTQDMGTERPPLRETLTHDDVDDLVKWISRRHDSGQDELKEQEQDEGKDVLRLEQEEDDKKTQRGITHDKGSLAPEDVDELVRWVSRK